MAAEEQFNMNEEIQKLLVDSRAQLDSIKAMRAAHARDHDDEPPSMNRINPAQAASDAKIKRLIDKADRVLRRLEDSQ